MKVRFVIPHVWKDVLHLPGKVAEVTATEARQLAGLAEQVFEPAPAPIAEPKKEKASGRAPKAK